MEDRVDIVSLKTDLPVDKTKLKALLVSLLSDFDISSSVTYILTDDQHIQQLNRDFRNKDMPTDVLSFEMHDEIHLTSPLGEVYISLERAQIQAKEAHRSLQKEVSHLAIHGTLHLLGFEHDTDAGYAKMFDLENQYLLQSLT